MIVTRIQLGLIRAGKLGTAYVPASAAKRWHPMRSYVGLQVCERVDDEREMRDTTHFVTIIGLGKPQPIKDLVGRIEADPAYWELLYPTSRGDCVWVGFALGDWRDRPRFLAGRRKDGSTTANYTSSPGAALDPDAEVVDEWWLARFAAAASPFIEFKQTQRRLRENKAHAERGFSKIRKERI